MSSVYEPMWKELGLDLAAHDALLQVLGKGYQDVFLSQKDRAAGTGKFLEFMATSFQLPIEEFGNFALHGETGPTINSMCTVFADTEATSLMARGHKPQDIALALHLSVVKRSLSMLRIVSTNGSLVISGGVARNRCVAKLIEREIGSSLLVPEDPDMVGALGAALHGVRNYSVRY